MKSTPAHKGGGFNGSLHQDGEDWFLDVEVGDGAAVGVGEG